MKVYSVLIASVTLFVFYNLAVFQENICKTKNSGSKNVSASLLKTDLAKENINSNNCNVSIEKNSDKAYQEAHHVGQDDFALQVSGKDHYYLNTGVSFIVADDVDQSCENASAEIVALSDTVSKSASESFFSQTEAGFVGGFNGIAGVLETGKAFDIGIWSGNNTENGLDLFFVQNGIVDSEFSNLNQDDSAYLVFNNSFVKKEKYRNFFHGE